MQLLSVEKLIPFSHIEKGIKRYGLHIDCYASVKLNTVSNRDKTDLSVVKKRQMLKTQGLEVFHGLVISAGQILSEVSVRAVCHYRM